MDADYEESGLISDDEDLEGVAPTFSPHSRAPPTGRQLRFPRAPEPGPSIPAATPRRKDIPDGNGRIRLEKVEPLWLQASASERYLLLEDQETGDVLMPLIYMKPIFEANYSRKLSSLKNRLVEQQEGGALPRSSTSQLYWVWAFESPQNVKLLVRQQLGEQNVSHGHLRLILLPIVYNAMAQKPEMRSLPLFHALHRAMKLSTYLPLLKNTEDPVQSKVVTRGRQNAAEKEVFRGPQNLQATAKKYMYSFREAEESDVSGKRSRGHQEDQLTSTSSQVEASMREDLEAELAEVKRTHKIDMEGVHEEMAIMKNCIMQLYNVLLPGKLPEFLQQPALQMQQAQQAQQTPPRHMSSQQRLPLHGRQGMALRNSRRQHGSQGGSASHGLADMAVDDMPGPAMHREPSAGSTMSDDGPPGLQGNPLMQLAHNIKPELLTSTLQPHHLQPYPSGQNPSSSFPFISNPHYPSGSGLSPEQGQIQATPQSHTPAQVQMQARQHRHQTRLHPYIHSPSHGPDR